MSHLTVSDFTEDKSLGGPEGQFEALIKRTINVVEVLRSITLNSPGLSHETNKRASWVNNQLHWIYRDGDTVEKMNSLRKHVVEAEEWAEALFYKPEDIGRT